MVMPKSTHEHYLKRALELAQSQRGFCAPNPSVGAVVVKNDTIIAQGSHKGAGTPHAEETALEQIDQASSTGATLYVTLEPCCHWGRTPPCTELIHNRGIAHVVYGHSDPNPLVQGKGAEQLKRAGIECTHCEIPEVEAFYTSYDHWTLTGLPFVTAKLALTLNGKIAAYGGRPATITSHATQLYTHQCRLRSDAILTTARTIIADNPALNVRLDDQNYSKPLYIIDTALKTPPGANVFQTADNLTFFHGSDVNLDTKMSLMRANATFVEAAHPGGSRVDLLQALQTIGNKGVQDVWVEAGGRLFSALMEQRLVHRSLFYVAPKWFDKLAYAAFDKPDWFSQARSIHWTSLGEDAVCTINWSG